MLNKLSRKSGYKFVLSIGDEGAILTVLKGNMLDKRVFINAPSSQDLIKIVSSEPKAPIYVLVDVLDQVFVQHSFPPVSKLNLSKLIRRKLERDFQKVDITETLSLGRDKTGRKDWNYLFVSVRNAPPFSDWISAIAELPNRLAGIYLLSLESQFFLEDIIKKSGIETQQRRSRWQFLVSHNRVGGFRQVVFRDGKPMFTRIAQPIGGLSPDVIAGNIEQETLNTVEYVRRLGYNDNEGLDIFIIASQQVKTALENHSITCSNLVCLTPYEIAKQLNLENGAEEADRFGDVVAACHFAMAKKHSIKLQTPYTKKLHILDSSRIALRGLATFTSLGLLAASGYYFFSTQDTSSEIDRLRRGRTEAEEKLSKIMRFEGEFENDWEKVNAVSTFYTSIKNHNTAPLEFIKQLSGLQGFNLRVTNIGLSYVTDQKKRNTILKGGSKNNPDGTIPPLMEVSVKAELEHPTNSTIEQVLEEVDVFSMDIKRKFRNYDVSISGLPSDKSVSVDLEHSGTKRTTRLDLRFVGPKPEDSK
ncbi:MAG: hypothetical protein H6908_03450 [Hyphomicrobiales bacterium]|nr:hypothetical protein [Rickettsiales bacterium]MCP5361683.1 hypothetical protein [Hyphomicrobiales bacterium]